MRAVIPALVGMVALFIAGFVRGGEATSPDPELEFEFGAFYALGGFGPVAVVAGVALGINLSRD
jgi:hypothetical protein